MSRLTAYYHIKKIPMPAVIASQQPSLSLLEAIRLAATLDTRVTCSVKVLLALGDKAMTQRRLKEILECSQPNISETLAHLVSHGILIKDKFKL